MAIGTDGAIRSRKWLVAAAKMSANPCVCGGSERGAFYVPSPDSPRISARRDCLVAESLVPNPVVATLLVDRATHIDFAILPMQPIEQILDGIGLGLGPAIGIALGAALLLGIVIWLTRLRRPQPTPPPVADLSIDVSQLGEAGPPATGPRLELYHVPMRLAAMVIAPTGRGGQSPDDDHLPAIVDQLVPGCGAVLGAHRPVIRDWPAQLSTQGFANTFFALTRLPGDKGKSTPWCAMAGRFEADGQKFLAGLVLRGGGQQHQPRGRRAREPVVGRAARASIGGLVNRPAEQLRRDAVQIWKAGVAAVRSDRLVEEAIRIDGGTLWVGDEPVDLARVGRIAVVGAGKAGAGMAAGLERALGPQWLAAKQVSGWINVPADCARPLERIHLHPARPAGVNEPTEAGVAGAREILRLVESLSADDLCFVLISGGGSALLPAPVEGVTLADKLAVTRHLSAAGAPITDLNTVRKQLSRIKGGGLARACRAGRLFALIISDVLGDPLDVIASGPTVPDRTAPQDALDVLERYGGRGALPASIFDYLQQRPAAAPAEPKCHVTQLVIGNNALAVDAAGIEAERLGYSHAMLAQAAPEGAAEEVGRSLAALGLGMLAGPGPDCFISGGEPVVKLAPPSAGAKEAAINNWSWPRPKSWQAKTHPAASRFSPAAPTARTARPTRPARGSTATCWVVPRRWGSIWPITSTATTRITSSSKPVRCSRPVRPTPTSATCGWCSSSGSS